MTSVGLSVIVNKRTKLPFSIIRNFTVLGCGLPKEGSVLKVLVVDDNSAVRNVLSLRLARAGFSVTALENGKGIEKVVTDLQPEIIVTDILMGGIDGLETIKRLRQLGSKVKIIAMSGGGQVHDMGLLAYARSFGADATLPKPFLPSDLIEIIERLVREDP